MKLLADENLDNEIILQLRKLDFDIVSVREFFSGYDDFNVLKISFNENRILITEDKDFGELVNKYDQNHCGIILLRLQDLSRKDKINLTVDSIKKYINEFPLNFTVITSKSIRIKKHIKVDLSN